LDYRARESGVRDGARHRRRRAAIAYAPTSGRLAAAMATICAKRRPSRDGALQNKVATCRMLQFPAAPAEQTCRKEKQTTQDANVAPPPGGVEGAGKIAT